MPSTRIVVPCFNEEARLDTAKLLAFAEAHPEIGLLFVDDGSTDRTAAILAELAASAPNLEAMGLERNAGKAEAVRLGLQHALSEPAEVVGFWDADLATPLEDIVAFRRILDDTPGASMVIGSRVQLLGRDIRRDARRHYLGRIMASLASRMLGLRVYDTQCGAKLFRATGEVRALFEDPFLTRWLFDVEILARWIRAHPDLAREELERTVVEVPLFRWVDVAGSRIRPLDFAKAPLELRRIHRHYFGGGAITPGD